MPENENQGSSSTLQALKQLVQSIWVRRKDGFVLPEDFLYDIPVTPEQVAYLLSMYPFVQLVNTKAEHFYEGGPQLIKAKTGWTIHDYGDAMSTSLGMILYVGGEFTIIPETEEADKGGSGTDSGGTGGSGSGTGDVTLNPGQGTVINQTVNTAYEMIEMAKGKKWSGVNIIAGTPLMQWAAWMASLDSNLRVEGFTPDEGAQAKRARISASPIPSLKKKFALKSLMN
jgi:hypothetical protein